MLPRNILSLVLASVLALAVLPESAPAQEFLIKFATLAPEGSTWMNIMKEYDQAVRKESGGRLGFKIYPGGVQGDEKDVLRKIKLGQLSSAGITGVGMTNVAPEVRILDSPFLFRSTDEVDEIYRLFDQEFSHAFEQNGFVNLGWAEVGFVYMFTNSPVKNPADMKGVKMWMWEGDPIAESAFQSLGIHPIPLTITDVLTSLQTGLIDGVYTSPYAAVALQWFSRVKYMLRIPLADAAGSVVIAKKKFDEIPPDLQQILLRNGKLSMQKLTQLSRQDNQNAIETLRKNGVTIIDPPNDETIRSYEVIGTKARRMLVGKLFGEDLLNRVEAAVNTYRAKRGIKE